MSQVLEVPERPALGPLSQLAAAILPVVLAALIGSWATTAGLDGWYASLNKPGFTPPNGVFPIVWSLLYALNALALWRLLGAQPVAGPSRRAWWLALAAFGLQLALNAAWSPIFFAAQDVALALVVAIALLMMALWTIRLTWRFDRLAAWLLVPYAAWLTFACLLNGTIWQMN